MTQTKQVLLLLVFIFLTLPTFGQNKRLSQGLSPQKNITQYTIDIWTNEDGLVSNTLNNVAQSRDGYIWVSSYNGIARFDGIRFQTFAKSNTTALESNSAEEFIDAGSDGFWIVFHEQGIISYQNNQLKAFESQGADMHQIESFFKDGSAFDSTIWIRDTHGKIYFRNNTNNSISPFPYPSIEKLGINCVATENEGNVFWWGTQKGLVRQEGKKTTLYSTPHGVVKLMKSNSGLLWVRTEKGLYQFDGQDFFLVEDCGEAEIFKIIEDTYQSVWIASSNGLFRQRKNSQSLELLDNKNGLWNKFVKDIFIDREGSLWGACYKGGLFRLKDGDFTNYTVRDGFASNSVNGICEFDDNSYLIALDGGQLHKLSKEGQITGYGLRTKLPEGTRFKHLYKDSKGIIWLSTYSGLIQLFPDGRERVLDQKSGMPDNRFRVVLEDSKGNIWVGTRSGGVIRLKDDKPDQVFNTNNGLGANYIMSLEELPDGRMAVGTLFDGLYIIDQNEVVQSYTENNGLSSNRIFSIYAEGNQIWLATTNALILIEDGNIHNFTSKEGLCNDSPFDILKDDQGNFWLSTPEGVCKVAQNELLAVAHGDKPTLECHLLNKYDGMFVEECTGAVFSYKGADGRMWFPTIGGLASIHPNETSTNDVPPPVHISGLVIDNQPIAFWKPIYNDLLAFSPGTKRFNLQFTGLTFRFPEKTRFRYRLLGFEDEWSEVINERQAIYTNLAPGKYTFQVMAANEDQVWSEEISSIHFQLEPFFYQSPWFWAFCAVLALIAIYLIYQARIKAIKKANEQLQHLVQERTKEIASQKDQIELQHKELESAYKNISTVSEMGKNVTSSLNMDVILLTVYENVSSLMDADSFALGTYDEQYQELKFAGLDLSNKEKISHGIDSLSDNSRLSVWCFNHERTILINDPDNDVNQYPGLDKQRIIDNPMSSFIYLPIFSKGKIVGVLTVQSINKNAYSEHQITILEALAAYISTAIENASVYGIVTDKNKQITDSIRYAQTIQQALLPSHREMQQCFEDFFILFRPKDIVSGDFYWFTQQGDTFYLAVMDCTGHGVPGAFMSLLGLNLLTDIINVMDVEEPADILNILDQSIIELLHQKEGQNADGMDAALCKISYLPNGKVSISYAGAKQSLFYTQNGELHEIKGTVRSIGGFLHTHKIKPFVTTVLELDQQEILYLSTDGFADQNGPKVKKIGGSRFKKLLYQAIDLPIPSQFKRIESYLDEKQGSYDQRDDITVVGVQLKKKE